ncbi:ABC transporter ATP-binding protein [Gloeocapsa sp. PCC 73106]|uniref:ABC transporter ATP-binding protein n=1 Tax=Gloeocapsa sp. PCC 73106 TaxID=102232 RepID=UPI0002AC5B20|nr:ABC transporter ATP-binding protein [Gloeocapsa sp. PCC 73106]ELR98082.1 ATPase component of various ABC-type transport systems with duplicated ATPase domain [Gloeocapsa sp. PCC 73106]
MSELSLDVRELEIKFSNEGKETVAVEKLSFQLKRGKTLGIVGESGSGKSVTSLAVMGLIPNPGRITKGEIWLDLGDSLGRVNLLALSESQKRDYRGGKIGMIFQEPMSALNPVYNIGFQIAEGIQLHQKVSNQEARRRVCALLQEVKLLGSDQELTEQYCKNFQATPSDRQISQYINQQKQNLLKRYPHELSGGQLQRVMIALGISCHPHILIADEPTTALDVTVQATILNLIKDISRARGMSVIFISHDLGVIATMADEVAVMYRGKIVELGEISQILNQPKHPYTKGLLACRPRLEQKWQYLPTVADFMTVTTTETGEIVIKAKQTAPPQIVTEQEQRERLTKILEHEPLLKVRDLCVGFPQRGMFGNKQSYIMAVNNVSFELYPGETLGLVGESGCGKSTLARTILRLIPSLQGEISFWGENIATWGLGDRRLRNLRRQMQIVFQNPYSSLNPRLTIGKAINEPMIIHGLGGNKAKRTQRVAYLLERVGINPSLSNRYPHEFSGGQRQRVCIARALAINPQLIICDESVSSLDVSVQAQVLNLLKELQEEFGLTYLFISHDLSVVKFISDRIMVMNQGKIEEIGSAEAIYRSPTQAYTRQLIDSIPTGGLS